MSVEPIIRATGLIKIYQAAGLEAVALKGLDLTVERGEFIALVGPSGSGKSTLLAVLAGLDRPSAGQVTVDGRDLLTLSSAARAAYQRSTVGLVWQQTARNLLPYLSARANIELLLSLGGVGRRERYERASELLAAVVMVNHAGQRPSELSGGQQQRVAIACALAAQPTILLGDELTGELDWAMAQQILALLHKLQGRYGLTVVIVTHDARVAAEADRVVEIRDGQVAAQTLRERHRDGRLNH